MPRLWIWRALFSVEPTEAVLGTVKDCDDDRDPENLMLRIDFLGNLLRNLRDENKEFDVERVIAAVEKVDTSRWSFVVRGYYGTLLKTLLPQADYRRKSGFFGRAFVSVASIWDFIQIDHMGCAGPLLLMGGVAAFFLWGLDPFFGKPPGDSLQVPRALFSLWIVWAVINVRTHFSGHKSIVQKFFTVLVYFGTLFSAIVTSIAVRL